MEAAREAPGQIRYKAMAIRMPADFLSETMENGGKIKTISDLKNKIREFVFT